MKIVYLLDCFPQISETFILNEIVELKKIDPSIDLLIYSLREPKDKLARDSAKNFNTLYINKLKTNFFIIIFYALKKFLTSPISVIKSFYYFAIIKKGNFVKYYLFKLWFFLFNLFKISYRLENKKCSRIHSHFALISTQFAMCIHLLTKIPFSFTSHAYDIFVTPQLIRQKHRYASFAVTVTQYNKKYLVNNFSIEPDKIKVIYCGVDTNLFKRKIYTDKDKKIFTISSIGRLIEKKGFPYLIGACNIFKNKYGCKFQCIIIGSGKLYGELKNLIEKYRLYDEVKLIGAQPQNEVIKILQNSDVFVLPCVKANNGDMDGYPVVIKEAMAMGIPTISTTVSGIAELMGDTGFLVQPKNQQAIFEKIEKIYLMENDEKNKIGKKERAVIQLKSDITIEVKKLLNLFKVILEV